MNTYVKTHGSEAPVLEEVYRLITAMRYDDLRELASWIEITRSAANAGGKSARRVTAEMLFDAAHAAAASAAEAAAEPQPS